ncbi:hypothetical protein KTC96_10020 [Clostridium estertheticum]|uniref:hypothetical protein n=1 Tax=Clostridium estertheticum TaxID=238834 RepID=UPI00271463DA|nr:hypothetical protein [Clostridium estertheticum]WLC72275.1 hypothetical protein KTC96_10020 [Clostridium estertheticum]
MSIIGSWEMIKLYLMRNPLCDIINVCFSWFVGINILRGDVMLIIKYNNKYRDDMIYMVLEEKMNWVEFQG